MIPKLYKYRVVCVNKDAKVVGFDLHWTNATGATNIARVMARKKGLTLFTVMPGVAA